jgi:DNA-binding NarL/FixJ family response regulator
MAIVIVSGLDEPTAVDDALTAGADYFLPKPVDFDALWQIVDDTVRSVFRA